MINTALVVPSNRPDRLEAFARAWGDFAAWDRTYIVFDGPETPWPKLGLAEVSDWRTIDADLGDRAAVISRRDSAIRSYGFYRAWADGADVIVTLDDDCHPIGDPAEFVAGHLRNLAETPRWCSSVEGLTLRGMPYRNRGLLPGVALSVGLWTENADLDAIHALAGARDDILGDGRSIATRVMPATQYWPMCGMNLVFRREITPLMFFAPMGTGQPYRRFDDIWCGLAVQRICRHLDLSIACGHPLVRHTRASDPFANLVAEAPGIGANERFWESIEDVDLTASDPIGCMRQVGAHLARGGDHYLGSYGRAIGIWCSLFD